MKKSFYHQFRKQLIALSVVVATMLLFTAQSFSQGVAISNNPSNTPDASAILDLSYINNKGFLAPKVQLTGTTDGTTISNPATGLLVYHTGGGIGAAGFYYNSGTPGSPSWVNVGSSGGVSSVSASAPLTVTNPTTTPNISLPLADGHIFIGNTSNVPVARLMSGDATISNTGVLTIGADAVGSAEITNGSVANADLANMAARTVKGNPTNAAAAPQDIQGTADQVLRVNSAGDALGFGAINLASGSAVSGILPLTNGGTNANLTAVNGGVVWSNASQLQITAAGTSGDVLVSGGLGAPSFQPLDAVAWKVGGNTITNPTTQYIGTNSNHDFITRTNNTARMKVEADGDVFMGGFSTLTDPTNSLFHVVVDNNSGITWAQTLLNRSTANGHGVGLRFKTSDGSTTYEPHKWVGIAALTRGVAGELTDMVFYTTRYDGSGGIPPEESMRLEAGGASGVPGNLVLKGQIKIEGGSPGANKVLRSDGSGLGTWVDPSTLITTTVSNTSSGNSLSTTVNGVTGTPVNIINSNALSQNGSNQLISTINGVASTPLTVSIAGDVTGNLGASTVERIRGTNVAITGLTSGNILQYNGTSWVNQSVANLNADLTADNGVYLSASPYDGSSASTLKLGSNPIMENTTIGMNGAFTFTLGSASSTGAITIGQSTAGQTVNIANANNTTAQTINIGAGANGANNVINIGSGTNTAGATTVTIGSNTNLANVTTIRGGNGTGAITLTPQTTGTIVIGAAAGTGAITVGSSSVAQTLNLGTGAGLSTVNIATGAAANVVNINNGAAAGLVQIGRSNMLNVDVNGVGVGQATSTSYRFIVNGKVKSTGINETSDERLKTNFASIDNALNKVLSMNGKYYDWRTAEFPQMNLTEGRQVGVIAQEIEKILPEVVTTGDDGYKAVEYGHIVPVLIEAIKEQQKIIDSQKSSIDVLKASLENTINRLNILEKNVDVNSSKAEK